MFFFIDFDPSEAGGIVEKVEVDEAQLSENEIEFFNDGIRKAWDRENEEWYFSIIDVVGILIDADNNETARNYWKVTKHRLLKEGNETVTNCNRLKMPAADGKMRLTDCANTEQLLRIIQSIPSKKAEPFKLWLARVGTERLEEMADPEKAIDRGFSYYREKGYSEDWIKQRMQGKSIREELTDEWKRSGIKDPKEYAALTNALTVAWSGKSVKEYKQLKGLHKENLRDNMTDLELTLNQLAEVSTTALSKAKNPVGYHQSKEIAIEGGAIAGNARRELEEKLGQNVISPLNATNPSSLDVKQDKN